MDTNLSIIAGTYRISDLIDSNRAGNVYLAQHIRLDKKVVITATKRVPAIKLEVQRCEADAIKSLSQAYIPQVYDFVEKDGIIYTVMDHLDGDSFDKLLNRGERFSEAQVIVWACQLLEALVYLHSRPPYGILHTDIKPANIMLTTQGNVCLIDFNIALALGAEEDVTANGRSYGYAAPELYGVEYTSSSLSPSTSSFIKPCADVRSDIYGLGATLYHLLTGIRPALDAIDVQPLSTINFNPSVVDIITKAMNPNRDLRYMSAQEMLYAFRNIHRVDYRWRKKKRLFPLMRFLWGKKKEQLVTSNHQHIVFNTYGAKMKEEDLPMRIFLSYARKDESLADSIDEKFAKVGITLARDKRDIRYCNSIKDFMKQIRSNDYVVLVLSPDYLKSANCMYEITELTKDENYKLRILPVVKRNTEIFDSFGRNSYIVYWQDAFKKLNDDSARLEPLNRSANDEDLKRYERIMRDLPVFLKDISDKHMIQCEDFIDDNDFAQIMERINRPLRV